MNLLTAENINKSYTEKILLDNISLSINDGDKIGIIGVNGTGKSTFLKILAGLEIPDNGKIIKSNITTIGYLPQDSSFNSSSKSITVIDQIFKGTSSVMKLIREYENTLNLLSKDPDNKSFQDKLFSLNLKMDSENAWEVKNQAKIILTKLGIVDFNSKIVTMSGGQKKRIALASSLITPSNILILDEPTNHLDSETIEWLEEFLKKRSGALIMVTHDRFFLDKITNRILELDNGKLYSYNGNYSYFLEKKEERLKAENSNEKKRKNLIKKELIWIRKGAKARSTKQKARIQRFKKLTTEKSSLDNSKINIDIQSSRLGKNIINATNISKSFNGKILIKDFSYNVLNNDRIGILGSNGSGKSTLMNILSKKIEPDNGNVEIGETVRIGYYCQQIPDVNMNQTVIDFIREKSEHITTSRGQSLNASKVLENFLFDPSIQWTPLGKLSGGEIKRLYLLKTLMKYPNVLLLDEPTNDLDIETLTILENYLENFQGPIIAVSHDRYFLDKVVNKIFVFSDNGSISQYTSNYSYFHQIKTENQKIKEGSKKDLEKKRYKNHKENDLKFTYKEKSEFDKIEVIIENLEKLISQKESEIEKASSNYIKLEKLIEEKKSLKAKLEKEINRWIYLNDLNEKIQKSKKKK